jgi:hypothetical protein
LITIFNLLRARYGPSALRQGTPCATLPECRFSNPIVSGFDGQSSENAEHGQGAASAWTPQQDATTVDFMPHGRHEQRGEARLWV